MLTDAKLHSGSETLVCFRRSCECTSTVCLNKVDTIVKKHKGVWESQFSSTGSAVQLGERTIYHIVCVCGCACVLQTEQQNIEEQSLTLICKRA